MSEFSADESGCPSRSELLCFTQGRLADEQIEAIGGHLGVCRRCVAALAEMEDANDSFVDFLRDVDASLCEERGFQQLQATLAAMGEQTYGTGGEQPPTEATFAPQPRVIGNYILSEKLGQGAMGAVYRAWHTRLKREVAIKLLAPKKLDPDAVERFSREMEAIGRLVDHPHVVRAYDAGDADGHHYLVMNYVDGIDLGLLLRRHGPLSVANACEAVRHAAQGLAHAHLHGLLHCDVKPANLMLNREGRVQVLDLGLASFHDDARDETTIAGTADYMAPEQWKARGRLGVPADIYGLGCTLYKLLTGTAPFATAGATVQAKRRAHERTPPPTLQSHKCEAPAEFEAFLRRMVAKKPADRPKSPEEVERALAPFTVGADLQGLADLLLTDEEDTARGTCERTLLDQAMSRLPGRSFSRRQWLALIASGGVAAISAGSYLRGRLAPPPYEMLSSAEPQNVAWEFDPEKGLLRSHATTMVLYRYGPADVLPQALAGEFAPLERDVEAGLFFGYRVKQYPENPKIVDSSSFIAVGTSAVTTPSDVQVFMRRYTVNRLSGDRVVWTHEDLGSSLLQDMATSTSRKLLQLGYNRGRLISIAFNSVPLEDLITAGGGSKVEIEAKCSCGVFHSAGAANFWGTELDWYA